MLRDGFIVGILYRLSIKKKLPVLCHVKRGLYHVYKTYKLAFCTKNLGGREGIIDNCCFLSIIGYCFYSSFLLF